MAPTSHTRWTRTVQCHRPPPYWSAHSQDGQIPIEPGPTSTVHAGTTAGGRDGAPKSPPAIKLPGTRRIAASGRLDFLSYQCATCHPMIPCPAHTRPASLGKSRHESLVHPAPVHLCRRCLRSLDLWPERQSLAIPECHSPSICEVTP